MIPLRLTDEPPLIETSRGIGACLEEEDAGIGAGGGSGQVDGAGGVQRDAAEVPPAGVIAAGVVDHHPLPLMLAEPVTESPPPVMT